MNFNDMLAARGAQSLGRANYAPMDRSAAIPINSASRPDSANRNTAYESLDSEDSDEITLSTIISERPKTSEVREFFKVNLKACKSDVMSMFE